MALAVRSTSSASSANSNSVVVTAPAGIQVGDLLIIIGENSDTSFTCTGFSVAGTWNYSGPGSVHDCNVTMLYKIADSGDAAAGNFTVSGSSQNMSPVGMLAITGWVSGNPIWLEEDGGFNPTSSGTFTLGSLSMVRRTQQILLMIGASYDATDSDSLTAFTSHTVTSGDSNPAWTEVVDTSIGTGASGVGRKWVGVAYATTTTASSITSFSYSYTESGADNRIGALGILIILQEPVSVTSDISHNAVTPAVFAPTVTQVNVAPTVGHLDTAPTVHGAAAKATAPTQWQTENKPTTTWEEPDL